MQGISYIDVDYCQFSEWGYQKPTRFWCSKQIASLPNCLCDGNSCTNLVDTPNGKKHRESLGGEHMGISTALKNRIPNRLIDYLLFPVRLEQPIFCWEAPVSAKSQARSKSSKVKASLNKGGCAAIEDGSTCCQTSIKEVDQVSSVGTTNTDFFYRYNRSRNFPKRLHQGVQPRRYQ